MQTIKRTTIFSFPAYAVAVILALALAGVLIVQPLNTTKNQSNNPAIAQPGISSGTNIFDDQMIAALKESKAQAKVPSLTVNSYPSQEERYQEKLERLMAPSTIGTVANTNAFDDQMIAALKESRVQAKVPSLTVNSHSSQQERYLEKLERLMAPSTIGTVANTNAFDDQMIAALKESKVQAQVPSFTVNSYLSQQERYLEKLERLIALRSSRHMQIKQPIQNTKDRVEP